jgi:hypothetical protein
MREPKHECRDEDPGQHFMRQPIELDTRKDVLVILLSQYPSGDVVVS